MKMAPGRRFILRMPPSVPWSLIISSVSLAASFLVMPLEVAGLLARLELLEQADALLDRDEVGEHAAEPALVDVRLLGAGRLLGDRLLGLLLGADEQDRLAAGDGLADELEGDVQALDGLGEVDDVDPVALREDERAHLGVPAAGLVAEVDSGLEQLPHRDGRHGRATSCSVRSSADLVAGDRPPWRSSAIGAGTTPVGIGPRVSSVPARSSARRGRSVWRLGSRRGAPDRAGV